MFVMTKRAMTWKRGMVRATRVQGEEEGEGAEEGEEE